MQRDRAAVAGTWRRTAQRDLDSASTLLDVAPSLAAFHAQQAAGKALKALIIAVDGDHPRIHSTGRLMRDVRERDASVGENLLRDAWALDLYYQASRYPDAVGDEDPGDVVSREDGETAIARARRIFSFVDVRLA